MGYPDLRLEVAWGVPWHEFPTEADWNDISRDLLSANIKGGKQSAAGRYEARTLTAELRNESRQYEPGYASSPHFPYVRSDQWVRARAFTAGGKYGAALDFDGSNDYLSIGDVFDFAGTAAFTVEAWIKPDSYGAGNPRLFDKQGAGSNGWRFFLRTANGQLAFQRNDGTLNTEVHSGTTAVPLGSWTHVAVTYDGVTLILYINAIQRGLVLSASNLPGNALALLVGGIGGAYFDGVIDEVRIWNTARTPVQILADSLGEIDGPALDAAKLAGLVGYWRLNDGTGTTAIDLAGSNNGTLTNGPNWVGVPYPMFTGFIDIIEPEWELPNRARLEAVDAFKAFAKATLGHPYVSAVRGRGPYLYYRLNEAIGAQYAIDETGQGRAGTYLGPHDKEAADPITDDDNGAVLFYESGYLEGSGESLPAGSGSFSIEVFFKCSATDVCTLAGGGGGEGVEFFSGASVGGIVWRLFGGGRTLTASSTLNINDGAWHHCVGVYDEPAKAARLIVDGIQRGSATDALFSQNRQYRRLWFANQGHGLYWRAAVMGLDEIAIYPKALTTAEALANYEARNAWLNDLTGKRFARVLDAIGWPASRRSIDPGISQMLSVPELDGRGVLDHMKEIEEAERGAVYMAENGDARFRDRHALLNAPYTVSQVTIGRGPGELPYRQIVPETSIPLTRVTLQRRGGVAQIAGNEERTFMPNEYVKTGLENASDNDVADAAFYLLGREEDQRVLFRRVVLQPAAHQDLWLHVLARKLDDRVTIKRRAPDGSDVSKVAVIIGTEHQIDIGQAWETTWSVDEAETRTFGRVGVVGLAEVGQTTRLGY